MEADLKTEKGKKGRIIPLASTTFKIITNHVKQLMSYFRNNETSYRWQVRAQVSLSMHSISWPPCGVGMLLLTK